MSQSQQQTPRQETSQKERTQSQGRMMLLMCAIIVITLVLVVATTKWQASHKEAETTIEQPDIGRPNQNEGIEDKRIESGEHASIGAESEFESAAGTESRNTAETDAETAAGAELEGETQAESEPVRLRFEAELGELHGTEISTAAAGYSGSGYVSHFTADNDHLVIPVEIDEAGLYTLYIGYRAASGYKESELYVNEQPFGKIVFAESGAFANSKATRVLLEQGESKIELRRGWGYFDIDYIELERYDDSRLGFAPVTKKLSNPDAIPEAVQLMDYLNEQAGKFIVSGQQLYSHIADIENITGKRPAIVGFDFIEYSPSRAAKGSRSTEVEAALSWHKQGGIVTFLWHWNAPTGLIDEPGKEWWKGFYTDSVTFNLAEALADKEGEQYQMLLSDMDVIARQIKILKLNDVPVLFRPLHEAEGGWFWWGASGPEAAKELYRMMYDRFVHVHQLNNLIWVWNSVDPAWYPGDDVVDIVSYDSYPVAGDHSPIVNYYDALVELTGGTKYIAMMENGSIPDPDAMEAYGANWGLFITWNGHFTMDGEHNSKQFLQQVYNHPRVITLDELPRYKELHNEP